MILKNKKILNIVVFLSLALNLFSESSKNSKENGWKQIEMKYDLNKDGVEDVLLIVYKEQLELVNTIFIPFVKSQNAKYIKGKQEEKTFSRDEFQSEFNNYLAKYVDESKKEVTENSDKLKLKNEEFSTSTPKINEDKNKEEEKISQQNTISDTENLSLITENKQDTIKDITTQENKENNAKPIQGKYEYTTYYLKERPQNLTFNYKYLKNSPIDMDEFIFIKTATSIRTEPNTTAKIIKSATYSQKYKVVGKVKTNVTGAKGEWYEIYFDGKLGYVPVIAALKREFDWQDMMNKVEKTNTFIKDAINKNQKIYVLDDYVSLGGGSGTTKDKYGNRENQSERGYLNKDFKEFINIPDRSLMTIIEETDSYIKVKIQVYDDKYYYLKKSSKKHLKVANINEEIKRFIYVDRHSQNEMIIEKEADKWNVVTSSFVTTGKDAGSSFATPYGTFLIAYSKPVMQYVGSQSNVVVGDANHAVRFSGGGYMHSIPSLFEPKATRPQRKAATARKIGTYAESHKCIRHYDDQIKFIYDWLGNSSPGNKNGYRVPLKPTVMLVK